MTESKKGILRYQDLFIADFWRYLLKAGWLYFPSVLFLIIAYAGFWHLVQGKDLMVITLEDLKKEGGHVVLISFILGLFFWIYVTWFSARLVTKAKVLQTKDTHYLWKIFREQIPRLLGFTCITIILLAFFRLENPNYKTISSRWCHLLLLFSFGWYFTLYRFWRYILSKKDEESIKWLKYLRRIRLTTYIILAIWLCAVIVLKSFGSLISLLIGWQIGLVLLLMVRREIIKIKNNPDDKSNDPFIINPPFRFWKKLWYIASDKEDRMYFRMFSMISLAAFIIYLGAVYKISWAVFIGSFPFILLAFGVLLGIGNLITFISVTARFNFHIIFLVWAFVLGFWEESHYTSLEEKKDTSLLFSNRKHLREYFKDWVADSSRNHFINKADSLQPYPIYFVLANGGASRSGYWTAAALSQLEEKTNGKFSEHLFCLSGASGGSVGTATFFSLLRAKKKWNELNKENGSISETATSYLSSDFLTYTISHLLCTDIFRNIIPSRKVKDRAAALAVALEKAPGKNHFLHDSLATGFSNLITQKGEKYNLPILCINTTRMQMGIPAVISNISIEDEIYFNGRLDVLSLLDEKKDMKLSTAIVLGASFPYISPAGRIDKRTHLPGNSFSDTSYYFVDGAYFDNSGAGVVNEMLIYMDQLLKTDPEFKPYRNKLQFHVIQFSNNDPVKINTGQINPIANDLLSPVKTLMGAYGSQTTVNDQRLKNFLYSLYNKPGFFTNIDLYQNAGYIRLSNEDSIQITYSMNWVISDFQRSNMDKNLRNNEAFKNLSATMMQTLK